jgi:hypothetical protein
MKTGKVILIGGGVLGAAALAYYLYSRKASGQSLLPSASNNILPSAATPPDSTGVLTQDVKQTLFKDAGGNIFEFTSTPGKYGGYVVNVNGKYSTSQVAMGQEPDGTVIVADSEGSTFEFVNGGWKPGIKRDKSQASALMAKYGVTNINYSPLSGLGNVYLLS